MKLQILLGAQLMIASTVLAQDSKMKLLGDFQEGWEKSWIERKFYGPPATFEVVEEDADSVLQVKTNRSGSALWHSLNIKPTERTKISWRWKIEDTLPDDTPEKKKLATTMLPGFSWYSRHTWLIGGHGQFVMSGLPKNRLALFTEALTRAAWA